MYDIAGYLIYDLCGVPNPQVENLCAVNCYIYLMELNSVFLIWVSLMSDIDNSQKQCNEGPWSLFFIDRIMAYNNKWERNDNSIVCFNQVARLFWLKKDLLTWECCITPVSLKQNFFTTFWKIGWFSDIASQLDEIQIETKERYFY